MTTIEASIRTPFRQAQEATGSWREKIEEACRLAGFLHPDEVSRVAGNCETVLVPLVYSRTLEAVTLTLDAVSVSFTFDYEADPDEEDELDLTALELVRETPAGCVLEFHLSRGDLAEFLGARDLELCASEHIQVVVTLLPQPEEQVIRMESVEPEDNEAIEKEEGEDGSTG